MIIMYQFRPDPKG